ncbi:hypothetical protein QQP08_010384, partial [Theobroma cacao]
MSRTLSQYSSHRNLLNALSFMILNPLCLSRNIREILTNEVIEDGFDSDNFVSDEDIANRNKIILLEANSTWEVA